MNLKFFRKKGFKVAREEQHLAYYDNILQGKSYIDNRLSIQTAVADFLAQTFFGKDFKRVVYTSPNYAFRKRIEALAHGIDENVFISNLELPFCSYYLDGQPEIIKTMSASEWNGYYDESIGHRVHFYNTVQKCSVQFFFDRSDDATVAFEIAQTESLAGYPIRYIQDVFWRNKTIPIPVWITIKKVTAGNESFNEAAWLEKSHMFAMTLDLEIEVARVHIHRGKNAVQLPFKWHSTGNVDTWKDGDVEYYTQKCVLMWANKAWDFNIDLPDEPESLNEVSAENVQLLLQQDLKDCDEQTLRQVRSVLPNNATAEMVEGYFKSPVRVLLNKLKYNPKKTTIDKKGEVTAWIDILVKPSTYQYWDCIDVYIPSRKGGAIKLKDCKETFVQIDGLHPNSTYTVYFIARDINGNFNTIPLEFTTPVWKDEILPAVSQEAKPEELVTTVEKKEPDKPTIIRGRGLIGLDL